MKIRYGLGLLLVLFGVSIILGEFLEIDFMFYIRMYWPLILILYGAVKLVDYKSNKLLHGGFVVVGAVLLADNLNLIEGNSETIIRAAVIIILGLGLLGSARQKKDMYHAPFSNTYHPNASPPDAGQAATASSYTTDEKTFQKKGFEIYNCDIFNDRFLFSNDKRVYLSHTFSGGDLDAYFSSIYLDLSYVQSLEKNIDLNVNIYFSNVNIKLPDNWHIILNGKHYFPEAGSYDQEDLGEYQFKVNGNIAFGEINFV